MAILDIRNEQKEEITGIKFDGSSDVISWNENCLEIGETTETTLCDWENFDNFIAALHKAKELAGK